MNCQICTEKFTNKTRKNVTCPKCHFECCRKCLQIYLLSIEQLPQCMNCYKEFDRRFIHHNCDSTFIETKLRKHRENILFNIEKVNFPSTQSYIHKTERRMYLLKKYFELIDRVLCIDRFSYEHVVLELQIDEIVREYKDLDDNFEDVFIKKCHNPSCKGYINNNTCTLCEKKFCNECNEEINENHTCDQNLVKTMKEIKKYSKACPNCKTFISKTDGCNQIWCVECHTAFDWETGEIEKGKIHNPHYINLFTKYRDYADIPCGGCPTLQELRNINPPSFVINMKNLISKLKNELRDKYDFILDFGRSNLDLRVKLLKNIINEDQFKQLIQRKDKNISKSEEVKYIYNMVIDCFSDLLRGILISYDYNYVSYNANKIIEYANTQITEVRIRYNTSKPENICIS